MISGNFVVQKSSQNVAQQSSKNLVQKVVTSLPPLPNWWPICLPKSKAKAKTTLFRQLGVQFLTNCWPICLTNFGSFVDKCLTNLLDYFLTFFEIMQKSAEIVIKCGI